VFHQSVVLLLEHSATQGAKGVILNRPLPASFTASLLRDKPQGHTQGYGHIKHTHIYILYVIYTYIYTYRIY
jgi:putative AlgH/UPF0301 family transcriptional regulator